MGLFQSMPGSTFPAIRYYELRIRTDSRAKLFYVSLHACFGTDRRVRSSSHAAVHAHRESFPNPTLTRLAEENELRM